MNSNYLYLMHESFPPLHLDFSPSFLHSKKPKVQPLILWENILRRCLASKKKKIAERKRKQKRPLYFTKYQIYISWSLGKSSPRESFLVFTREFIQEGNLPFLGYFLAKELHEWLNTRRKWKFKHKNIRRKRVGTNIPVSHVAW